MAHAAAIIKRLQEELTPYVAAKRGTVSIAHDHWHVLEVLGMTPAGFLLVVHYVGKADLGQARQSGIARLKFEIIVAKQRGLRATPGQELIGPTPGEDPLYVLEDKVITRIREIKFPHDDTISKMFWFKNSEPFTAPDGALFNAQKLDFQIDGTVSDET